MLKQTSWNLGLQVKVVEVGRHGNPSGRGELRKPKYTGMPVRGQVDQFMQQMILRQRISGA
jgi:hypothetical protein